MVHVDELLYPYSLAGCPVLVRSHLVIYIKYDVITCAPWLIDLARDRHLVIPSHKFGFAILL